jgi:hypothetical protein
VALPSLSRLSDCEASSCFLKPAFIVFTTLSGVDSDQSKDDQRSTQIYGSGTEVPTSQGIQYPIDPELLRRRSSGPDPPATFPSRISPVVNSMQWLAVASTGLHGMHMSGRSVTASLLHGVSRSFFLACFVSRLALSSWQCHCGARPETVGRFTHPQVFHTYILHVDTPGTPGNQAGSCDVAKTAGDRESRAYRRSGDPFAASAIEKRPLRRSRGVTSNH